MIDVDLMLARGATYRKMRAGESVFSEGEPCFYYYQLVGGQLRWVNINEEGKECLHYIIEPGDSFGELPLFDESQYAASAIANKESVVIKLRKESFHGLIKEKSEIHFAFTKLFAKRIRFKFSVIRSLACNSPESRIATLLNYLKSEDRYFSRDNQLKLTRQQIADMTGLRIETVIRTMRNMHDKGELAISRGKVYCEGIIQIQHG
jgi:CRP/FNR family cyclic AMP-dependent transcriptional regulator